MVSFSVGWTDRAKDIIRHTIDLGSHDSEGVVHQGYLLQALLQSKDGPHHEVLKQVLSEGNLNAEKVIGVLQEHLPPGDDAKDVEALDYSPLYGVFNSAKREAENEGMSLVDTTHLLLALLSGLSDPLKQLVKELRINLGSIRRKSKSLYRDHLDQYGIDLTAAAAQNRLDSVVGREAENNNLITALKQRRPCLPMLVGDSGVGKTAVVEGLAQRIAAGSVPPFLRNSRIICLQLGSILSAGSERGVVETRIARIVQEAEQLQAILFIDDFESLIEGRYQEAVFHCANLIKMAVTNTRIRAVGEITTSSFRKHILPSPWYRRRMEVIPIRPLDIVDTVNAIKANSARIARHYECTFSSEAIENVVLLASRHDKEHDLPGSAIRLLDEIASKFIADAPRTKMGNLFVELDEAIDQLNNRKEDAVGNQDFEKAAELRDDADSIRKLRKAILDLVRREAKELTPRLIDDELVGLAFAAATGLPPIWSLRSKARNESVEPIRSKLLDEIVGQDDAVNSVLQVIPSLVAANRSRGRPLGTFLFAGPSGTGKTLLAQQLATHLLGSCNSIVQIDLSTYTDKEDLARFLEDVDKTLKANVSPIPVSPHRGILVLEHLDSVTSEAVPLISSWIREGWKVGSYDWSSRIVNWLVILTTRGGIEEPLWRRTESLERTEHERARTPIRESIGRYIDETFATDFVNRIDGVVVFTSFTRSDLENILRRVLSKWRNSLHEEGILLQVNEAAFDRIVDLSQVPALGARMLEWNVERLLKQPLAEFVVASQIRVPQKVLISAAEKSFDGPLFKFTLQEPNGDDS